MNSHRIDIPHFYFFDALYLIKQQWFYRSITKEFNRKQANDLAKKFGISQRSADIYLKKLTDESLIKKLNHGMYKK